MFGNQAGGGLFGGGGNQGFGFGGGGGHFGNFGGGGGGIFGGGGHQGFGFGGGGQHFFGQGGNNAQNKTRRNFNQYNLQGLGPDARKLGVIYSKNPKHGRYIHSQKTNQGAVKQVQVNENELRNYRTFTRANPLIRKGEKQSKGLRYLAKYQCMTSMDVILQYPDVYRQFGVHGLKQGGGGAGGRGPSHLFSNSNHPKVSDDKMQMIRVAEMKKLRVFNLFNNLRVLKLNYQQPYGENNVLPEIRIFKPLVSNSSIETLDLQLAYCKISSKQLLTFLTMTHKPLSLRNLHLSITFAPDAFNEGAETQMIELEERVKEGKELTYLLTNLRLFDLGFNNEGKYFNLTWLFNLLGSYAKKLEVFKIQGEGFGGQAQINPIFKNYGGQKVQSPLDSLEKLFYLPELKRVTFSLHEIKIESQEDQKSFIDLMLKAKKLESASLLMKNYTGYKTIKYYLEAMQQLTDLQFVGLSLHEENYEVHMKIDEIGRILAQYPNLKMISMNLGGSYDTKKFADYIQNMKKFIFKSFCHVGPQFSKHFYRQDLQKSIHNFMIQGGSLYNTKVQNAILNRKPIEQKLEEIDIFVHGEQYLPMLSLFSEEFISLIDSEKPLKINYWTQDGILAEDRSLNEFCKKLKSKNICISMQNLNKKFNQAHSKFGAGKAGRGRNTGYRIHEQNLKVLEGYQRQKIHSIDPFLSQLKQVESLEVDIQDEQITSEVLLGLFELKNLKSLKILRPHDNSQQIMMKEGFILSILEELPKLEIIELDIKKLFTSRQQIRKLLETYASMPQLKEVVIHYQIGTNGVRLVDLADWISQSKSIESIDFELTRTILGTLPNELIAFCTKLNDLQTLRKLKLAVGQVVQNKADFDELVSKARDTLNCKDFTFEYDLQQPIQRNDNLPSGYVDRSLFTNNTQGSKLQKTEAIEVKNSVLFNSNTSISNAFNIVPRKQEAKEKKAMDDQQQTKKATKQPQARFDQNQKAGMFSNNSAQGKSANSGTMNATASSQGLFSNKPAPQGGFRNTPSQPNTDTEQNQFTACPGIEKVDNIFEVKRQPVVVDVSHKAPLKGNTSGEGLFPNKTASQVGFGNTNNQNAQGVFNNNSSSQQPIPNASSNSTFSNNTNMKPTTGLFSNKPNSSNNATQGGIFSNKGGSSQGSAGLFSNKPQPKND